MGMGLKLYFWAGDGGIVNTASKWMDLRNIISSLMVATWPNHKDILHSVKKNGRFRLSGKITCLRFKLRPWQFVIVSNENYIMVCFSLPQLKAQMRFLDQYLSLPIVVDVNLSHCRLFLQNHRINFNQT